MMLFKNVNEIKSFHKNVLDGVVSEKAFINSCLNQGYAAETTFQTAERLFNDSDKTNLSKEAFDYIIALENELEITYRDE